MKTLYKIGVVVFFFSALGFVFKDQVPADWKKITATPDAYALTVDATTAYSGNQSGCLKSIAATQGDCYVQQRCDAAPYRGKKVKITGYLKTQAVADWAGMFCRVDSKGGTYTADNMKKTPLTGNTDWVKCEIVLDVHPQANSLAYGVSLRKTGTVWFDNFSIAEAQAGDAVTALPAFTEGLNLGFEE